MSLKLNERYPGRFNNPSADYPGGSFKNRTTPDAKDGSYLEKDWANDKEGFFQSLLSAAGITASGTVDKVGASQFFDALQQLKQNQSGVAFTTTGPSAALVLSPIPAITSYSAGQRFRIKFNRASTGTDTINISGIGPKPLKQYDASGGKVAAIFAIDQLSDVEYDGTDIVLLDQLPAGGANLFGVQGTFKNLAGSATGLSAAATYKADEIMVENSSNQYQVLRAINISPLLSATGANGLDTGTSTASTWYSVWVIWNGSTTSGLFSLSATSPTMPAGYTHKARVGWVKSDSTANKYPLAFRQSGRRVQSVVAAGTNVTDYLVLASGSTGGTTFVAISISSAVPSTAGRIVVFAESVYSNSGNAVAIAPSATSPRPITQTRAGTGGGQYAQGTIVADMVLESSNIAWFSFNANGLYLLGWEDNL